ncbi:carboxypeptidase regulatory-like domain-containing protein [Bacillus megaterium]|nr:carboxypeptidase regulatory-like domain-containing protein [Priestia megaterium]
MQIKIIIAFDLAPNPGIIRGQVVTSEAGQPIPNTSVVIRALTPSGPILATTVTDSNGFYEVTGIVSGTYTVVFSAEHPIRIRHIICTVRRWRN